MSQHIKRDQLSQKIKIDFLLFPKCLFLHLNFGAKILKSDIAFLRYDNFIEDVITHWWKIDFEIKPLKRICTKYWYFGNSDVYFYMKTLFLHQTLQVTLRLSIEDVKICEISKLTLGQYFEIYYLFIPIT